MALNYSGVLGPQAPNFEGLELAGRTVEKMLCGDGQCPALQDKLRVGIPGAPPTLSGLQEPDYPSVEALGHSPSLRSSHSSSLHQRSTVQKVPLPEALVEQFGHVQCNCMIGLFPEIERAWLTIDSDIYVWRFEDQRDLAFYDSLGDAILSVGLLTPKPNIFRSHIKYLLCLTTATEIVLLGVTFSEESVATLGYAEMQLLPEPLYSISTDAVHMLCVKGTSMGRVFLGGKDGCLYEFAYKADEGWFGKKAQKINHSTSALSFLIPTFVNAALSEEDPIVQLEVDDSRNILFSRSEKGTIQVFDLGQNGSQLVKVAALTQQAIVKEAARVALSIDKSNFFPIVGIWIMNQSETQRMNLVAISASGVRFYFTATGNNPTERPTNLTLQHIRLPPGFAASSPAGKPNKAHISYYKNGTLLLACAQNESTDQLWLLSGDSFPFQNILMEGQSLLSIDGRVWAVEEMPYNGHLTKLHKESFGSTDPPLVTIQHSQPARKFVLVSAQGTHIVSKLRPVDHLRQLLIENHGPDSDVIKSFFNLHSEVQAACACLILACSQSVQDSHVAEWATRALFLYGGEPRLVFPQAQQPRAPQGGILSASFSTTFHPSIVSTPAPAGHHHPGQFRTNDSTHPLFVGAGSGVSAANQSMFGGPVVPEMQFSSKHNALYLYLSRLVRPVWLRIVVTNSSNRDDPFRSSVTSDELGWIMAQLLDFKTFFERQAPLLVNPGSEAQQMHQQSQQPLQDAFLRERQSLLFLQHLLNHTIQVLGLWRVVCDHQCDSVIKLLSIDEQNLVRGIYFRDLVLSVTGRELCARLIQAIINLYLGDNARTDAISNRLRDSCPSLYNNDDAIASKAQEILIAAKRQSVSREREKMISDAVALCKDVAAKLNLDVLVGHLVAVHAYVAVVEICLAAAAKRDPQGLALHHYKNMEPSDDHQGTQAFLNRTACYKHVTNMLRRLMGSGGHPATVSTIPVKPGPPAPPDPNQLAPSEASHHADQVLECGLRSDDELFHVEIYQWLLNEGHHQQLINIRSPFLEDFIIRYSVQHLETVLGFDLLWKYYEKNGNYRSAARFLVRLAEGHSTEIDLNKRLEYLSRAVVCVKSGEVNSAPSEASGDIHSLEEKMEVARVQLQLLEAISALPQTAETASAISQLHSGLLDISQLYSDFAEPYGLWECQLAILHCAGHPDQMLAQTMWTNILESEWSRTIEMTSQTKINALANKIKSLGKLYSTSQKYFPLEHIVRTLEVFSAQMKVDFEWVFKAILTTGIPLATVLEVYHKLNSANDPVWLTHGSANHLLIVMTRLLELFANNPNIIPARERRHFLVRCQDVVGSCLGFLYTKHDTKNLVQEFRSIQAKLERMESGH